MNYWGGFGSALIVVCATIAASAQSQWTPVQHVPNIGAGAIALLTDGRVLVHDESGNPGTWQNWWTLTPDINGRYETGTWTQVASLPPAYGPLWFASAVLPDGRYIVEGGEDNNGSMVWTNMGAIYDPVANTWTTVNPPAGWSSIGDASSAVLANGTFMMGSCCARLTALLNPSTLTWTSTGSGKFDIYDEEGLTLLPSGKLLDVDAYVSQYQVNGKNWEMYDPSTGRWTSQGATPEQYWDSAANCGGQQNATYELGPSVLMPNGTVFQAGANRCGAAHNGIYHLDTGTWTEAPDFPNNLNIPDGPAALETNGKLLMMAGVGFWQPPSTFLEWDGTAFTQIPGPPNAPQEITLNGRMLMLPTGQILFTDSTNDVELFNSTGSTYTGWNPTLLLNGLVFQRGHTYRLTGSKFNGASQNSAFGDDFQDATNYPLVRLTNVATGHVFYARTHDHSTMAVGYNGPTYTYVDIPANMERGATNLQVVVNGIASQNYLIGIN